MQKISKGPLIAYQFHNFNKFSDELDHAVFSRVGGVSTPPFDSLNVSFSVDDKADNVRKNRALICDGLKLPHENLLSAHQTHSKNVLVIDEERFQFHDPNQEFNDTDAFVTNLPNVGLMIKVADCQAIIMFDPVKKVIANVHAGWKGLVHDVSGATIKLMKEQFGVNPENIMVGISPSLGPCCSFFSDPEKELPNGFGPYIKENKCVDLWQFSNDQLKQHGILSGNIELARVCSFCEGGAGFAVRRQKYFSFRRDRGVTGRFGVVAFLKG